MFVKSNGDFLFLFEAAMSNPNGDPDQENKPRMDYETDTLLVSDARRKRDSRDFIKTKGYQIFVDSLADTKVPMDVMFEAVINNVLKSPEKIQDIFEKYPALHDLVRPLGLTLKDINSYFDKRKEILTGKNQSATEKKKRKADLIKFNNEFLTAVIKEYLIDIQWFGSAMAIEGISKIYTGPIQINWGYSLHPVELVKSNTITSIMNDDNSTFGKKHKVYYALIAHPGTINKRNAQNTGLTEKNLDLFRKALVQGLMNNQTDSKQGQVPILYMEIVYKPEFDGYLGDLRRFINTSYDPQKPIRKFEDLQIDFSPLEKVLMNKDIKDKYEKILEWQHPLLAEKSFFSKQFSADKIEKVDLLEPIPPFCN